MTNETLETIKSRRSCRAYKPEQITDEELNAVLEAGTYAASAMGRQSAKIVVVQDAATRAQLTRMNAAVMGKDTDPMYGAPTILVVLADAGSKNAVQDGSLVMGNLMLAAASLGLGSCWINRAKEEFESDEGKALLRQWGIEGDWVGEEKSLQSVQENKDFIDYCEKNPSDMLKAMFGGHALFTISDKTFDRMVAANNGRVGYHIHVSEGMNDVYDSLQNYGRRPVQRLQDHGILGPKTILGHCIHVNTAEMDIIKATDTMCVNNPESNMGNAVGCSPILQLYKKGILVGLGTDAYTNDMLESIKVALIIQRHNACMPNVGWCEVTDMLFKNNAKMAARTGFPTLGVLAPGAAADVIVMDYKPFTPFSDANIDGHMLFGMTGRQCQTTMINGKILMKDRVLTEIDEEAVNAHILESSKRLWGKLNHCEY